ncbi:hypothetical protein CVIRNUC_002528 [Coccomyxa viridis]|uniref:Mitogen-activated protein kinase organizer 1 n=1 Tax=Coccomyxa viridis TaxID=1274662 RepID=A0AAV1HW53_9CHLO|nr:hypothetical protein CVIRNUC_002528 [Coccomyxa viridis]
MLAPPGEKDGLPVNEAFTLRGHDGPVLGVRFNKAGTYCLSCGKDRAIKLWNPHKGNLIKTYNGHGYDVRDAVVSSDNSKFASCGGDRQVFLWDVSTGRTIRKFRGHDGVVNSLCMGPGEETLVTGGYDQAVRVWDMRSRSFDAIQTMKLFADSVTTVAVSTRAEIIASSVDGTVRRFDVRMGCMDVDRLGAPVTAMALSHDGNCVLASCLDGRMRLLDKASGELLAQYTGHKVEAAKMDCALTPSDACVLSGSEDGRVCYWDLVEETMLESFQAHKSYVCSLAMHPDGTLLLTSSTDGTVKVWQ